MQLDEFVRTTLVQIAKGVKEAQTEVGALDGVVNPRPEEGYGQRRETSVTFDVALTVSDTSANEVGGKLTVASVFNFGGKASETDLRQESSRVQFAVTMALPCTEDRKPLTPIKVQWP